MCSGSKRHDLLPLPQILPCSAIKKEIKRHIKNASEGKTRNQLQQTFGDGVRGQLWLLWRRLHMTTCCLLCTWHTYSAVFRPRVIVVTEKESSGGGATSSDPCSTPATEPPREQQELRVGAQKLEEKVRKRTDTQPLKGSRKKAPKSLWGSDGWRTARSHEARRRRSRPRKGQKDGPSGRSSPVPSRRQL